MTGLAIVNFFGSGRNDFNEWLTKFEEVGSEFKPVVYSNNFLLEEWPGLKEDSSFIVRIEQDSNGNVISQKYLARLSPDETKANIRQAIVYALAGKFDNISEEKSKTIWRGGDPSSNGIFEGSALDLPWPRVGVGDILDKLKQLLSFNWVPWWAWAAVSTVATVKATRSKSVVGQALYGVLGGYSGFRAIKKYNK